MDSTYLTLQELMHITLSNSKTQQKLMEHKFNTKKYINIILDNNLGGTLEISTYEDYLLAFPKFLSEIKQYVSEGEYKIMLLFRHQVDALVYDTFKELI